MFLMDSLSNQVKGLMQLDDEKTTGGLDAHIDDFRKVMEQRFVSGQQKQAQRKKRFKEKPEGWDSDLDGHWTAQPGAIEDVPLSPEPPHNGRSRTQATSGVTFSDDDDDVLGEEPAVGKAPAKRSAAATRGTKKAAPAKKAAAPAKKPAAPKKAPAPSRSRRKANPFQDSDEEEEEEDVVMEDDDEEPVPPPKPTRETRTRGAAKGRQTTLNFSQSQKPTKATKKAIEISDDEISEDDAFESMPATRSRRR